MLYKRTKIKKITQNNEKIVPQHFSPPQQAQRHKSAEITQTRIFIELKYNMQIF